MSGSKGTGGGSAFRWWAAGTNDRTGLIVAGVRPPVKGPPAERTGTFPLDPPFHLSDTGFSQIAALGRAAHDLNQVGQLLHDADGRVGVLCGGRPAQIPFNPCPLHPRARDGPMNGSETDLDRRLAEAERMLRSLQETLDRTKRLIAEARGVIAEGKEPENPPVSGPDETKH
jgi:hypothetical protein